MPGENFLYVFKPPYRADARPELARGLPVGWGLVDRANAVGHARHHE